MALTSLYGLRIVDGLAHRRMDVQVLGAGKLKSGTEVIYVRRAAGEAWAARAGGHIYTCLEREVGQLWREVKFKSALRTALCDHEIGETVQADHHTVAIMDPKELLDSRHIVVEEPDSGWLWRKSTLSVAEAAAVAYNFPKV